MAKRRTGRRVVAALLLTHSLLACTGWRVQKLTPRQVVEEKQPSKLLITTFGGAKIELREPIALSGDTLTGRFEQRDKSSLVRLPLASVKTVAVRGVKPGATMALVLAVMVAATVTAIVTAYVTWPYAN